MEEIDFKQLIEECIEVTKGHLGKSWKAFKPYAEHELKKFAESAEFLAKLRAKGKITDDELQERLEFQKQAFKSVLLTIEGIGLITAQNVTNAILDIVGKAVKAALGTVL